MQKERRAASLKRRPSWLTLAKRLWPRAYWIVGEGSFATVADCRTDPYRVLTVMLHETREEAERIMRRIDSTGCGGACCGNHILVDLASPQQWPCEPQDLEDAIRSEEWRRRRWRRRRSR